MLDHEAETRPVDSPELTEYRRRVRRAAIRFACENDYCVATLNEFLGLVDLQPFRGGDYSEFRGTATITGYYRMDAPVLTADEVPKQVRVVSTDPEVRIDRDLAPAVVAMHDDRIVMVVHITVVGTRNGATATSWAISALELLSTSTRTRFVLGLRDPVFDRSNVTEVVYTEQTPADPDADCWDDE